jgi:hypothetical protein
MKYDSMSEIEVISGEKFLTLRQGDWQIFVGEDQAKQLFTVLKKWVDSEENYVSEVKL